MKLRFVITGTAFAILFSASAFAQNDGFGVPPGWNQKKRHEPWTPRMQPLRPLQPVDPFPLAVPRFDWWWHTHHSMNRGEMLFGQPVLFPGALPNFARGQIWIPNWNLNPHWHPVGGFVFPRGPFVPHFDGGDGGIALPPRFIGNNNRQLEELRDELHEIRRRLKEIR